MRFTIGLRILLGFGLGLLLLVLIGGVAYRANAGLVRTSGAVAESYQIIVDVDDLLASLNQIEASSHGFVISGDPGLLQPYRAAVSKITADLQDVRTRCQDRPDEKARLEKLEPLIDAKLREAERMVQAPRCGGSGRIPFGRGRKSREPDPPDHP
jgi:CHASE3 domain sensor protein